MKHNTRSSLPSDLSVLRQRIRHIHEQMLPLLTIMMDIGPMMVGSMYETYRTCSYQNCRCHKGHKHGPFPSISYTINGTHKSRPVRKDDVPRITAQTEEYKKFQKAFSHWRTLCEECEELLVRIRELSVQQYQ